MSLAEWTRKRLHQGQTWGKKEVATLKNWWRKGSDEVGSVRAAPDRRPLNVRERDFWPFVAGLLAAASDSQLARRVNQLESEPSRTFWQRILSRRDTVTPAGRQSLSISTSAPEASNRFLRVRRALAFSAGSALVLGGAAVKNWQVSREAEKKYPPNGRFVIVGRVRLHYFEKGTGPDVVLLHGNFTCAEEMILSGVFDRIAKSHRVVAFDRPGFGYSSRTGSQNWTPEHQARVLRNGFRQLGLERPVIVAHSFATLVALSMAAQFPDEIGGLVLISGAYFPEVNVSQALLAPTAIPFLGDALRYTISPVVWRFAAPGMITRMFSPRTVPALFRDGFPLDLALRPEQIHATSADAAFLIPAILRLRRFYRQITAPVILMAGEDDEITDAERHSRRLSYVLINNRLHIQPGCGHMVHFAIPDIVAAAVSSVCCEIDGLGTDIAGRVASPSVNYGAPQ
jgi:pimeloyl-ACP methyl ester carboxylesterase